MNFHLHYLREFKRFGWETHVGCAGITRDAPHIDRAIDLPFKKQMRSPDNFCAARVIRCLVQKERYDLVIAHTTLIEDGVNGMLYPYRNVTMLTGRVRKLMDSVDLRASMGQRAKQSTERYSLDNVLPAVMDCYMSVLT